MNSSEERPSVLIAALSGRALAESACKAGYLPLVADLFGDLDARRHAHALRVVRGSLAAGFDADDLAAAIDDLERRVEAPPLGLVCGAGFEDRADLLAALGCDRRLLGCPVDIVAKAKDPLALASLCARLRIPHPALSLRPPADPEGWLAKRIGGSGGWHVGEAEGRPHTAGTYYQRQVRGDRVSALVLGTGHEAAIIGWSAQWTDPAIDAPYRWGGAVQPAPLEPAQAALLSRKALDVAITARLIGLASLDFLIGKSCWHLLEINPRPGSTLDVFDDGHGTLFESHVQACLGRLIVPQRAERAQACAIVFAERDIECVPETPWPDWCADLPTPGSRVRAREPVCTVRAAASGPATARRLVGDRRRAVLRMVHDRERETARC